MDVAEQTSPPSAVTAHTPTLTFALHPNRKLRLSLHTSISTNPHTISKRTAALPSNDASGDRYAILDARRIVGPIHVGIAANSALLRIDRFQDSGMSSEVTAVGKRRRGAALETVLCAGGSTNVGSVMKDFGFSQDSIAAASESESASASVSASEPNQQQRYDVLFLAYDCKSDTEFKNVLSQVGLDAPVDQCSWNAYFARERNMQEMQEMAKLFKLSPEELTRHDFSLESAVLNRVAVKYSI